MQVANGKKEWRVVNIREGEPPLLNKHWSGAIPDAIDPTGPLRRTVKRVLIETDCLVVVERTGYDGTPLTQVFFR